MEITTASGTDTLRFLYENGSPIGYLLNEATPFFYVKNLAGDITAVVTEGGAVAAEYCYDSWGNLLDAQGDSAVLAMNPLTYRGYLYDSETGLYYLQTRYYNPQWCRFINADTNLDTGTSIIGTNLFAYCDNNPVMKVDPTGAEPGDVFINWLINSSLEFMEQISVAFFVCGLQMELNIPEKIFFTVMDILALTGPLLADGFRLIFDIIEKDIVAITGSIITLVHSLFFTLGGGGAIGQVAATFSGIMSSISILFDFTGGVIDAHGLNEATIRDVVLDVISGGINIAVVVFFPLKFAGPLLSTVTYLIPKIVTWVGYKLWRIY